MSPFPLQVFVDAEILARAAARLLRRALAPPPEAAGLRVVMLAGGRTPLAAYAELAAAPFPVPPCVRVIFSDDRRVPPDDPRSNYGACRPFLDALGLGPARVLRIHGEQPGEAAAAGYAAALDNLLHAGADFHTGLLGLGADGHTASLFSAAHVHAGRGRSAQAVDRPDGLGGITVTADVLARFRHLVFLVAGAEKREAVARLRADPLSLPAGLAVRGAARVEIWADSAAAAPHP